MNGFIKIFLFFVGVLIISCCSRHSANTERLDIAENLMWGSPDSALTVLNTVSPDSLAKGEERARYALLLTMAMDKTHLSPTNDSLIASAVDYYKSKENIPRLMVGTYYRGRVQQHNGRYPQALLCFYKAKDLAEKNDSSFWAGMACRGISDIYGENYNRAEELTFAQKEYEYIKKSGRQPYLNYALCDLSRAYANNGNHLKVITLTDQIIDSAIVAEDPYLYYGALHLKSYALIGNNNYSQAYSILSDICESEFADCSDSLNLSLTLAQMGMSEEAMNLLDNISDSSSGVKSMIKYIVYRKGGQLGEAIKEVECIDSVSDNVLKISMHQNLAGTMSEYFEISQKFSDSELNASRLRTSFFIVLSLVAFVFIVTLSIFLYRRQRMEINRKVIFAEQLQEELVKTKESLDKTENNLGTTIQELIKTKVDLDNTKQNLFKSNERKEHSEEIIKYLLSSKYKLLEELIEIVIRNNDSTIAKQKIADNVTKLIDDFSIPSDKITELGISVDKCYNNLFSDFRKDLPNLKEADYRLFLFSILRLSTPAISLLLKEEKIEAVYNRKGRLKSKIKKLEEAKSDRYLGHIR